MPNQGEPVKVCSRCILPETFPGISFDGEGVCNHCRRESREKDAVKKAIYRARLDKLVEGCKGKAPSYDAIMAYSGGKDSSYSLKLIRERYGLRVLAVTFDNHFVSPMAWVNIRAVTDALHVDHVTIRPPWPTVKPLFSLTAVKDIFPKATLLRASSVCTACIGIVKSVVLKLALELSIPLVAFGWSPGQAPIQSAIMKTNSRLIRQNQLALKKALPEEIRGALASYFIPQGYYEEYQARFPYNIHPLAFFKYDESKIKRDLETLDWKSPEDTDTNSTNCLLNAFANQCHIERHKYHPYVWEIANMVRQGVIDKGEAFEKIYTDQDIAMVNYAKEKLEL